MWWIWIVAIGIVIGIFSIGFSVGRVYEKIEQVKRMRKVIKKLAPGNSLMHDKLMEAINK